VVSLGVSGFLGAFALMVLVRTWPDAASEDEQRYSGDVRATRGLGLI